MHNRNVGPVPLTGPFRVVPMVASTGRVRYRVIRSKGIVRESIGEYASLTSAVLVANARIRDAMRARLDRLN